VFNTNYVSAANAPTRLDQLIDTKWKHRVALAYPLFGSTATHFLVLNQRWGEVKWLHWCRSLQDNQPLIVDGNSQVVQLVGRGEAWIGLTDSDDVAAGRRNGLPLASRPLGQDGLTIRNSVALVRNAPHPRNARRLMEYLLSQETQDRLAAAGAIQRRPDPATPSPDAIDWEQLLESQEGAISQLKEIFFR